MRRVLTEDLELDPGALRVLDVGSGGGLLAEEFARIGCLLMIKAAQDWWLTRWAEPNLHDWDMFIRPEELEATMTERGFEVRDQSGLYAGYAIKRAVS
jgi:2-polyprenyl-3-methyl-5-hydroxy-6-metoxy-1,4-benzoquinol methylase